MTTLTYIVSKEKEKHIYIRIKGEVVYSLCMEANRTVRLSRLCGLSLLLVCCWFSTLLREVFLRVLWFSPLLKNQHFQIPIRSGNARPRLNEFFELLGTPWVNKLHLHLHFFSLCVIMIHLWKEKNYCMLVLHNFICHNYAVYLQLLTSTDLKFLNL